MAQFIVVVNDAEEKALLTDMHSIQNWLDNVVHEKARRVVNIIVEKYSDKQPKKMTIEEKHELIRQTDLETVAEKNARLE